MTSDIPESASPADYIMAQSFSMSGGYLTGYRKWESGIIEKWGHYAVTKTSSSNYSAATISFNTTVPFTQTPLVFISKPSSLEVIDHSQSATFFSGHFMATSVSTTSFVIYFDSQYNSFRQLSYYAIGKWK